MYRLNIYNKNNELIATEDTIEWNINIKSISQKLSSISVANLSIYNKSPICKRNFLKKWNIFKIFKLKWNEELLYFSWVLRWIEAKMEYVDVILNDKLYLLERRVLRENKSFENKSVKFILENIFAYINNIYNSGISVVCNIEEIIWEKEFRKNTNILSILQDLAKSWYEFIIKDDNKVYFSKNIWIDKSNNFIYTYNFLNPYGQNIDSVIYKEDVNNFANFVLSDDWWVAGDNNSIEEFWIYEKTFSKWYAKNVINDYNNISWDFSLQIKNTEFLEIDLGDLVYIDIETWSDFLYYKWVMKIVEKNLQIWDLEKITFSISKNNILKNNFFDDFKEIKNKVLYLN